MYLNNAHILFPSLFHFAWNETVMPEANLKSVTKQSEAYTVGLSGKTKESGARWHSEATLTL